MSKVSRNFTKREKFILEFWMNFVLYFKKYVTVFMKVCRKHKDFKRIKIPNNIFSINFK